MPYMEVHGTVAGMWIHCECFRRKASVKVTDEKYCILVFPVTAVHVSRRSLDIASSVDVPLACTTALLLSMKMRLEVIQYKEAS